MAMELAGYTSPVAQKIAGLATSQALDYWVNTHVIKPSLPKHGKDRRWSFRDLVALRTIGQLRDAGITLQEIRRVATILAEFEQDFSNSYLLVNGGDVMIVDARGLVSALKRPKQLAFPASWIIDLGHIERDVQTALKAA